MTEWQIGLPRKYYTVKLKLKDGRIVLGFYGAELNMFYIGASTWLPTNEIIAWSELE